MFKRRARRSFRENVRHAVWPRSGWRRALRYLWKRILRLSASPHGVAAGASAGIFAASTPLIGLHILLGIALAFLIRGNIFAAAIGTLLANPLTIPLILAMDYEIGTAFAGEGAEKTVPFASAGLADIWPLFKPLLIGGIILGSGLALCTYAVVYPAVAGFQRRRRARMAEIRSMAPRPGVSS
ncbi:DUF2062 domain-containing protein [Chthonobacter albigriseus]|uniref:DUF2062 domain-containing protein n=1 Tax=Chthonobacter albigriseus TaxID=1683161 RepID=UPI0018896A79|nr:DUF2062 domain-containing protein [Chthonobacter albigriseus]